MSLPTEALCVFIQSLVFGTVRYQDRYYESFGSYITGVRSGPESSRREACDSPLIQLGLFTDRIFSHSQSVESSRVEVRLPEDCISAFCG